MRETDVPLAMHEGAHLAVALLLNVPVHRASIVPGRSCVELAAPAVLARTAAGLRLGALIAAAGPAADRLYDPRGWRGYDLTDSRSDLAKVAHLAASSVHLFGHRLDVRHVLDDADRIVRDFSVFIVEAAQALASCRTLDAPLLARIGPQLGAGLFAERYAREGLRG